MTLGQLRQGVADFQAAIVREARRLLRRDAAPLSVLLTLAGLAAASVAEARWAPGSAPVWGLLVAVSLGALLARSRFGGWTAAAYCAVMFVTATAQAVGRVLPPLVWPAPPVSAWVWTLHLRTLTFAERVRGWWLAARAGETIHDTGLFVVLLCLLLWTAGVWLAWWALRRKQALAALLPLGVALAVNAHLSGQGWGYWCGYVVVAAVLLVQTNAARLYADWDRRGVDYPPDLTMDWTGAAVALALGAGLLGAAAPWVATPTGWHDLAALFEAARQGAADTAGQLFADVAPPEVGEGAPSANPPDLGRIGAPIERGNGTVMWVTVSDLAPPPPGGFVPESAAPPQHYWRVEVFATYTGSGWTPVEWPAADTILPADTPPVGRYALYQEFELVADHQAELFAVNQPVTVSAGAQVRTGPEAATARVRGSASTYSVLSWATRVTASELRAAPGAYPPEIAGLYLQAPEALPQRVRALAAQILSGVDNPYDQALRLQDYLRANYAYTLDVPPPAAGRDAVDYFLFEAPGGFCSYYASAMAVMLRTQGVAARVATGYAMGEYDLGRGAYRVPASATHAWVEVYFPGYGWVEFEPTAARAPFDYPAGNSVGPPPPTPEPLTPPPSTSATGGWRWAAALGVALGLAAAGWLLWRRARPAPSTARARALTLYGRMRRSLGRAGLGDAPGLTPAEFQTGGAARLAERPAVNDALQQITALHERAAYSPRPVSGAEVAAAESGWRRARRAWRRLWLR